MTQYKDLPIKINKAARGMGDIHCFMARVYDDALELSPEVVEVIFELNIRSASSLISYLQAFPTPVANVLGWTIEELNLAHQSLLLLLKDQIPNQSTIERPEVSFGAKKI